MILIEIYLLQNNSALYQAQLTLIAVQAGYYFGRKKDAYVKAQR